MKNRFGSMGLAILVAALSACEPNGSLGGSANPALTSDSSVEQLDAVDAGSPVTHTTDSTKFDTITATGIAHDTGHTLAGSSNAATDSRHPLVDAGTPTETHPTTQTTSQTATSAFASTAGLSTVADSTSGTTVTDNQLSDTLPDATVDPSVDGGSTESNTTVATTTSVTASPESTPDASESNSETTSTDILPLDAGSSIGAGGTDAGRVAPTDAAANLDASNDAAPSECVGGSERHTETSCGLNNRGKVEEVCADGSWVPWSCSDPDVCVDQTSQTLPCEGEGLQLRVCVAGAWQDTITCPDACAPDSTQEGATPCGLNNRGVYLQACLDAEWVDTTACADPDFCEDDATRLGETPCGLNARGSTIELCVAGQWTDTGSCQDTDVCVDDASEPTDTSCGLNERGLMQRQCVAGEWITADVCIDPDVCVDATSRQGVTACGLNARGILDQVCEVGGWIDSSECDDPDECADGAVQTGTTPCQGQGVLQQTCETGTWLDGSICIKPQVLHPNILLVVSDDVGAESTSIYPNITGTTTPVPTPTIEQLAAQGITFDNAWASPMCSPTRATILSGKYGNRTGVTAAGLELPTEHETLHERIGLESPTYAMGVFGKWHLSGTNENTDQANEVLHVLASGVPTFRGFVGAAVEDFFRWEAVDQSGNVSVVEQYSTTSITDWAIEYIQQREAESPDAPWFVYVPYNAAHDPYQVPPSGLHNVDVGGLAEGTAATSVPVYKAMLQALDTEFGRLMNVIDLNDTIVIYMGDNGTPREVKEAGSNIRGSKQGVYEGGVRVPLVISGAGVNRIGEREDDLVVSSDLYATILSLTGIDTAQIYDSFALNPLFEAGNSSTGRTHSFSELCNSTGSHYAIRNAQYKLMYEDRRFQLYDLLNDPLETRNLYSDATMATVRSELEAALAEIRAGSSAGCFR